MATIETFTGSDSDLATELSTYSDGNLLAQELVQKGAIHALQLLLLRGCTPGECKEMLQSMRASSEVIRAECERRGLPVVDTTQG